MMTARKRMKTKIKTKQHKKARAMIKKAARIKKLTKIKTKQAKTVMLLTAINQAKTKMPHLVQAVKVQIHLQTAKELLIQVQTAVLTTHQHLQVQPQELTADKAEMLTVKQLKVKIHSKLQVKTALKAAKHNKRAM